MLLGGVARSQTLIARLEGKWNIKRYSSAIVTDKGRNGTIEFNPDGEFLSHGLFFGTQKGTFRTDETRNVVLIETEAGITEWQVYMKGNMMRLLSTEDKKKLYLIYSKVKEE